MHLRLLFVGPPPLFRADEIDRHVSRRRIKPCRQHDAARQRRCLPRQPHEDLLGHVSSGVRIAAQAPPRRLVDEIDVPLHQCRKRRLGFFRGVLTEQLDVVDHGVFKS